MDVPKIYISAKSYNDKFKDIEIERNEYDYTERNKVTKSNSRIKEKKLKAIDLWIEHLEMVLKVKKSTPVIFPEFSFYVLDLEFSQEYYSAINVLDNFDIEYQTIIH